MIEDAHIAYEHDADFFTWAAIIQAENDSKSILAEWARERNLETALMHELQSLPLHQRKQCVLNHDQQNVEFKLFRVKEIQKKDDICRQYTAASEAAWTAQKAADEAERELREFQIAIADRARERAAQQEGAARAAHLAAATVTAPIVAAPIMAAPAVAPTAAISVAGPPAPTKEIPLPSHVEIQQHRQEMETGREWSGDYNAEWQTPVSLSVSQLLPASLSPKMTSPPSGSFGFLPPLTRAPSASSKSPRSPSSPVTNEAIRCTLVQDQTDPTCLSEEESRNYYDWLLNPQWRSTFCSTNYFDTHIFPMAVQLEEQRKMEALVRRNQQLEEAWRVQVEIRRERRLQSLKRTFEALNFDIATTAEPAGWQMADGGLVMAHP